MLDGSDESDKDESMEMEMNCQVVIVHGSRSNIDELKIVFDLESMMPFSLLMLCQS